MPVLYLLLKKLVKFVFFFFDRDLLKISKQKKCRFIDIGRSSLFVVIAFLCACNCQPVTCTCRVNVYSPNINLL